LGVWHGLDRVVKICAPAVIESVKAVAIDL
jgi:hypothetical protein